MTSALTVLIAGCQGYFIRGIVMFAKTRYFTPNECIYIGNKELEFVLLPNDIRRPNGREYRRLMEIVDNGKKENT